MTVDSLMIASISYGPVYLGYRILNRVSAKYIWKIIRLSDVDCSEGLESASWQFWSIVHFNIGQILDV